MAIGIGLGVGYPVGGQGNGGTIDPTLEKKVQDLRTTVHNLGVKQAELLSKQLTPDQIFSAENRGEFTGSGSLKSLGEGWWYIPETNTNVTGKPKGSVGDLLVYRRAVGSDGIAMLAFGSDAEGGQAWAQYKTDDSGGYVPWVKMTTGYILTMDEIIAELKKRGFKESETPVTPLVSYYAGYSTALPTRLDDLDEFKTRSFSIARRITTPERIFVAVDVDHASGITGISVDGGLPAVWQHRDYQLGGKMMRVFYSPGGFYETSNRVEIKYQ